MLGAGKRGKPYGVLGVEVRMAVLEHGAAIPADPETMPLFGIGTDGRATQTFAPTQVCKTAAWAVRYVGSKGQLGRWSAVVTATIAA